MSTRARVQHCHTHTHTKARLLTLFTVAITSPTRKGLINNGHASQTPCINMLWKPTYRSWQGGPNPEREVLLIPWCANGYPLAQSSPHPPTHPPPPRIGASLVGGMPDAFHHALLCRPRLPSPASEHIGCAMRIEGRLRRIALLLRALNRWIGRALAHALGRGRYGWSDHNFPRAQPF